MDQVLSKLAEEVKVTLLTAEEPVFLITALTAEYALPPSFQDDDVDCDTETWQARITLVISSERRGERNEIICTRK